MPLLDQDLLLVNGCFRFLVLTGRRVLVPGLRLTGREQLNLPLIITLVLRPVFFNRSGCFDFDLFIQIQ